MEQLIISGTGASGVIDTPSGLYTLIKSVKIDYPQNLKNTVNPVVTISGHITGATSFHDTINLDYKFYPSEDISITTTNFSGEYNAVINYVFGGEMDTTMVTRSAYQRIPTPWRFRT